MENMKLKQVLSDGWHKWKGGRRREKVKEGEYGGRLKRKNYDNGKMRHVETFTGMQKGSKVEYWKG
jgi:hypothetical protein